MKGERRVLVPDSVNPLQLGCKIHQNQKDYLYIFVTYTDRVILLHNLRHIFGILLG